MQENRRKMGERLGPSLSIETALDRERQPSLLVRRSEEMGLLRQKTIMEAFGPCKRVDGREMTKKTFVVSALTLCSNRV